jgi:hypothetical protein
LDLRTGQHVFGRRYENLSEYLAHFENLTHFENLAHFEILAHEVGEVETRERRG